MDDSRVEESVTFRTVDRGSPVRAWTDHPTDSPKTQHTSHTHTAFIISCREIGLDPSNRSPYLLQHDDRGLFMSDVQGFLTPAAIVGLFHSLLEVFILSCDWLNNLH